MKRVTAHVRPNRQRNFSSCVGFLLAVLVSGAIAMFTVNRCRAQVADSSGTPQIDKSMSTQTARQTLAALVQTQWTGGLSIGDVDASDQELSYASKLPAAGIWAMKGRRIGFIFAQTPYLSTAPHESHRHWCI